MLFKFKRNKSRKGFSSDRIFKGLQTHRFSKDGSHLFTTHKYLTNYFDDDRFCNMFVQWNEQKMGKIKSIKAKRLFPYYPSFIPFKEHRSVVAKYDFYQISSSIDYRCVNCHDEIKSEWGNRSIKNFLCSRCISLHFISKSNDFIYKANIKELYGNKFSKNILEFFKLEQRKEKNTLSRILDRRENYLKHGSDNKRKISSIYNNIKESLLS